jgi:hypothetical protein
MQLILKCWKGKCTAMQAQPLLRAFAARGDASTVERLLSHGSTAMVQMDTQQRAKLAGSGLSHVAGEGKARKQVFSMLLQAGADPRGHDGELALRNAARDGYRVGDVQRHWAKLGLFRQAHVAVGAGVHQQLQAQPYVFKRTYARNGISDKVGVALDLPVGEAHVIDVGGVFADGQRVRDGYSGARAVVKHGKARFPAGYSIVLIGRD